MRILLTICVVTAFLTGCGLMPNSKEPKGISDDDLSSGKAIVILSAGETSTCAPYFWLGVLPASSHYPAHMKAMVAANNPYVKSDFPDHDGTINAFTLDPGDYYFAPYNSNFVPVEVPKYDFSVSAGEVVYMGEYWVGQPCGSNKQAEFRDQQQRDMDIVAQQNAKLARMNVIKRIPVFSGYAVGSNPQ